jgi:hypothetical protein
MLQELGDRQPAHLLVVLLVAGDAEEAAAHRVFLMRLVGLDEGRGEHGGAEASNTLSSVHQ